jgi:hypothetical protein
MADLTREQIAIGDTHSPADRNADYWAAGIHIGAHGNRIECYGETKEDAERLREGLISALRATTSEPLSEERILKIAQSAYDGWRADESTMDLLCRAIRQALRESSREPALNLWRDAVMDELVVLWAYSAEHDTDPRKAVKAAIRRSVEIALNPQVSEDANALRSDGFREGIEAAANVVEDRAKGRHGWDKHGDAAAIRAIVPDPSMVSVPLAALLWLLGLGDGFSQGNAKGAFWWRSEFCERAGISDETVREWAMLAARKGEGHD